MLVSQLCSGDQPGFDTWWCRGQVAVLRPGVLKCFCMSTAGQIPFRNREVPVDHERNFQKSPRTSQKLRHSEYVELPTHRPACQLSGPERKRVSLARGISWKALSGPLLPDTARLSQQYPPIFRTLKITSTALKGRKVTNFQHQALVIISGNSLVFAREIYYQYWFLPVLAPRQVSTSSGNRSVSHYCALWGFWCLSMAN